MARVVFVNDEVDLVDRAEPRPAPRIEER